MAQQNFLRFATEIKSLRLLRVRQQSLDIEKDHRFVSILGGTADHYMGSELVQNKRGLRTDITLALGLAQTQTKSGASI